MFLCALSVMRQMWLCNELKIYLFNNSFQTCCLETNIIDWKKRMRNLYAIKVGIFGEEFFLKSKGLTDLFLKVICVWHRESNPFSPLYWGSPETQMCVGFY